MAERALTPAALAVISAGVVRPVLFFEGEYDAGGSPAYLRLFTGVGTLEWDGKTWIGGSDLLGISPIRESTSLEAIGFSVRMSGLPADKLSIALQSMRKNKPGKLWLGFFEPEYVDYDFTAASIAAKVGAGVSAITFTRAGATATRVNASGLIETVAADTPRFDFDPVTLECKGLLIEEARTNKCLRSSDFGTTWTTAGTPTRSAAAKACGIVDLDLIGDDNGAGFEGYLQTVSFTGNGTKAVSCFVAQGTSTSTVFKTRDTSAGADRMQAVITWSGGLPVVTMTAGTHEGTDVLPDGVFRIRTTTTSGVVAANTNSIQVLPAETSAFAGSLTGNVYCGGVQAEDGAFCTSHIPTTSAAVTRNADVPVDSSAGDWLNADEFTAVVEWDTLVPSGSFAALFEFNDGSTDNRMRGLRGTTGTVNLLSQNAGVASPNGDTANASAFDGSVKRAALAFKGGDFGWALDSGSVATSAAAVTLPTVDRLHFGTSEGGGGLPLNGHLRRFTYYPRRLSNADLQVLSGSAPVELAWGSQRLIADPYALRRGRFDVAPISREGQTMTIEARYEGPLARLLVANERRYTHEDQQLRRPGDKGFDQVPELQDAQDVWGPSVAVPAVGFPRFEGSPAENTSQ